MSSVVDVVDLREIRVLSGCVEKEMEYAIVIRRENMIVCRLLFQYSDVGNAEERVHEDHCGSVICHRWLFDAKGNEKCLCGRAGASNTSCVCVCVQKSRGGNGAMCIGCSEEGCQRRRWLSLRLGQRKE